MQYIRVHYFSGETSRLFSQALKSAEGDGRRGILIDLRNNPGSTLFLSLSSSSMCKVLLEGTLLFLSDQSAAIRQPPAGHLITFLCMKDLPCHGWIYGSREHVALGKTSLNTALSEMAFSIQLGHGLAGGVFEEAISMASMVLSNKCVIAQTVRNSEVIDAVFQVGSLSKQVFPSQAPRLTGLPIAIIINHGSASASEVFAGALQDNRRCSFLQGMYTLSKDPVEMKLSRESSPT